MAVLRFERGEMQLALFRRDDGFIWFHGWKPFGRPLATTAVAVQFLRDLCEIYNYTLDLTLPPPGRPGNTGRNAFRGPGLYNLDVSLSWSFPLARLGDAGRLRLRADAYNVFNHANLNTPENFLGAENFGIALYGRTGYNAGFPALVPFRESPRNFQFLLRAEF